MSVKIGDTIIITKAAVDNAPYISDFKVGAVFKVTSMYTTGNGQYCLGFIHNYPGQHAVSSGAMPNWNWKEGVHFTVSNKRYPQRRKVYDTKKRV